MADMTVPPSAPAPRKGKKENTMNQIPRRAYLDKMVPAERAIHDAIQAVEVMGADERLTDVVIALGAAKDKLSDYVDAETVQYPCGASASKGAPTVCPEHGSECHA